jgi:hypothetical protein
MPKKDENNVTGSELRSARQIMISPPEFKVNRSLSCDFNAHRDSVNLICHSFPMRSRPKSSSDETTCITQVLEADLDYIDTNWAENSYYARD